MKLDPSQASPRACRDNIRQLGFDPDQLTYEEQQELLDLDACLSAKSESRSESKRRVLVAR